MRKIIIIGAGGHAKSIVDCVDLLRYEIVGFIDENKAGLHYGYPILGKKITDIDDYKKYAYIIAIGDNENRRKWFEKYKDEVDFVNIIDKTAIVSSTAVIGQGNFIAKYAVINADVKIGNNNIINTKALVEHECVVGDNNHLSTGSIINGNVVIGNNVFLGSSAVCIGQLKIEDNVTVGAGTVVISDIETNATVVGVPARRIK